MDVPRSAGQATVDYLAAIAALAILVGALGTWLVAHVRDGPSRTPVVGQIARNLEHRLPFAPGVPDIGVAPRAKRGHRLAGAVRRGLRAARRVGRIAALGEIAFARGVIGGVAESGRALIGDPLGSVVGGASIVTQILRDPAGFTRAQVDAARAYVRRLRTLPAEAAYERLMHDLGEVAADVAVSRGKQIAQRAALRALRRRLRGAGMDPADQASRRHGDWHRDARNL